MSEEQIYKKVTWRLLPFIATCYMVAYLDRVNVGFAKLQMLNDLGMSEAAYGLGAGIFFVGYLLFEVPSNLILHRVGAKSWLARIMITWGIISGAMAYTGELGALFGVSSETMFYVLRFLLGLAEAGFFPGLILYLSYWYPSYRQARIVALLLIAQPVSFIIGGPMSGWIIDSMSGAGEMQGWKWMFIIEAIPAVVLGASIPFYLNNGIQTAHWLSEEEKLTLSRNLTRENKTKSDYPLGQLLRNSMVWTFVLIYFLLVIGIYGINFWLPSIIKSTGVRSNLTVGLVTAIPYAISVAIMLWASHHAEKVNEKRWHATIAGILAGLGLIASAYVGSNTVLTIAFISVAIGGGLTVNALFWSFPNSMLTGAAAAAGIATINSIGALGGFFGPTILGWLSTSLGDTSAGLSVLGLCLIASGLVVALSCKDHGLKQGERNAPGAEPVAEFGSASQ